MPRLRKNSSVSRAIGAAEAAQQPRAVEAEPLAHLGEHQLVGEAVEQRTVRPRLLGVAGGAARPARPGRDLRRSGFACAPAACMAACIFSHTRGTPKKKCGRTSRRFSPSFSRLSANRTAAPAAIGVCSETTCSAMWESGR